jgi:hypothetical protein
MNRTSLTAAALGAALLLAPLSSQAQLPRDPVERARVVAQIMEANARQLTLFDRQGRPSQLWAHAISTTSLSSRPTPHEWLWSDRTSRRKPKTSG